MGGQFLPGASSAPAFARRKISAILPTHAVLASSTVGIIDSTAAVSPERVIVTVVGPCLARSNGLALVVVSWHCQNTGDGRESQKEVLWENHSEGVKTRVNSAEVNLSDRFQILAKESICIFIPIT